MKALFKKETLSDPLDRNKNYTNFTLSKDVNFCCKDFKSYCKKFTGWDYEKGKFAIIGNITYEGNSTLAIDFCPFCGEKIEYEDTQSKQRKQKQGF